MLDGAVAVVEDGRAHGQVAARGERALGAVVEQAVHGDVKRGLAGGHDGTALVAQFASRDRGIPGRGQGAAGVVEVIGDRDAARRAAGRRKGAVGVAEGAGLHVQAAIAGDGAASVVDALAGTYHQQVGAGGRQLAARRGQRAGIDAQALGYRGRVAQVGVLAGQVQPAIGGDGAARSLEGVGGQEQ
ncbi:hypothetical protein D9M69_592630 [compost metagenome]